MTTEALALEHGACPRCPQPSWHNGALCPLLGAAKERERPVPCARCRARTFRNDAICDRCASTARVTGGRSGSAAAAPHSSPAGAFVDALQQPPAGVHP